MLNLVAHACRGFVRRMRGWHRQGGIINTLETWDRRVTDILLPPPPNESADDGGGSANSAGSGGSGAAANEARVSSANGDSGATNRQQACGTVKEGEESAVSLLSGNGE